MVTSKPGEKSEQSSAAWTDRSELARGWRVARFLPIFAWLPRYRRDDIAGDLMGGAVVAIMLVPQSMAYAILAGLPLQVGLCGRHWYTAFTKGQGVVIHDLQVNELVERAFAKMGMVRPPRLGDITLQGKD